MVTFNPKIQVGSSSESLAYDPEQDATEIRDMRMRYRILEKRTEDKHIRPQEYKTEDLLNQVEQADTLFKKVKNPTDATLDSTILRNVSSISAQKARAMKLGSGAFDVDDFITKLVTFMGGRQQLRGNDDDFELDDDAATPLAWDKIGRKALAKSRRVPVLDFMLGPLSIEQKKRVFGKRSKLEKNKEEERKPQELREEDIARSENETTKNVATIEKILAEQGAINIFRFIVNPNDFAQSVENMFYLSFLIRDGRCSFEITEEGDPIIYSCEPPSDDDYANGLKKQQIVTEFDMATWRRAIEIFNITESKIPQRPPSKTKLGDKWYG
ncbi:hypothetical protein SERLA73DRAFT_122130 [Serpula lacrymans var. lacrymans S7.3]|uniref:Non-structural maintenance of chromosomes element 4 n=2 Tax=Serpula lacrymans var. lacrymans TaxID=341189 RepID=F8PUK3_SERL3|nr:uncharacterized protein SERLADRAFT_369004 [Serpula lacrymans var. lacrymans S7.9]EGO00038.1 hypothetical protein SERLA73DRAFT_122130 [Serpula lacrymans var. lacrymans S7.3]EGO25607.1 hypothetical protein SERLADRAFT_369004 [Serpula lacrymans var. lacrymans S7.9]